ncbi:MAG: recombinase family protein [Defluviitaleaceae bacterium]|nr:recombinase family protein [Defluviitaleaceae bacterium]MCL2835236.1 recombinase family protein [Defluviitaleaceae bacterium]
MRGKRYVAGLYLRLSKDDERQGESASIENQRMMLTDYVREKGWEIKEIYVDDGWSGTNFQRPAFQRMLNDAENKLINVIIVKDLSRFGRNYIEVGRLTEETLPLLGCRFIALNDSVDTINGDNDMMAYRNLFNEFHCKDTSKKVRSVRRSLSKQGKFMGSYAPFGYKKDPLDKHRFIIDEETAPIVMRIFEMRSSGSGYRAIALALNEDCIPSPKAFIYSRNGRTNPRDENGLWSTSTVSKILQNEVYIGHMVQGMHGTFSYKNNKLVKKPEEDWIRVEGTHTPLVAIECWNVVKRMSGAWRSRTSTRGPDNIFSGILKCADCGFSMKSCVHRTTRKDGSVNVSRHYTCGNYARSGKSACSIHSISENDLTQLVLGEIREYSMMAEYDEQRMIDAVYKAKQSESMNYLTIYKRELGICLDRIASLDNVIDSIYKDRKQGVVSEGMFAALIGKHETERAEKRNTSEVLRNKIESIENGCNDINAWVSDIQRYTGLGELNRKILLELIERIEVTEAKKVGKQRFVAIKIAYQFIGKLNDELAAAGVVS